MVDRLVRRRSGGLACKGGEVNKAAQWILSTTCSRAWQGMKERKRGCVRKKDGGREGGSKNGLRLGRSDALVGLLPGQSDPFHDVYWWNPCSHGRYQHAGVAPCSRPCPARKGQGKGKTIFSKPSLEQAGGGAIALVSSRWYYYGLVSFHDKCFRHSTGRTSGLL